MCGITPEDLPQEEMDLKEKACALEASRAHTTPGTLILIVSPTMVLQPARGDIIISMLAKTVVPQSPHVYSNLFCAMISPQVWVAQASSAQPPEAFMPKSPK